VGAADLERGRDSYAREAWTDAYESLSTADRSSPLGADDLERLSTAAYMIGRETDYFDLLERAHRAYLDGELELDALRCALWIGVTLANRGDMGRAGGWLGRAKRLLDRQETECVEGGYMLLPAVFQHEARGDLKGAAATAGEALAIAERFGDSDLFALAAHTQGHMLVKDGRVREGLPLLDEAMVAVTAGELSPIVSGIVYCGVILACRNAHEIRRAQEWTVALTRWCERQPDLVAFTGRCLVHRAEILQLRGNWADALRAQERCRQAENNTAAGEACYRQGEIHRVRGDRETAESAYREASRQGREPQPGLALLRLAQGRTDSAEAAIRRVLDETTAAGPRAGVLPAYVEIMLAAGDPEAAEAACDELEAIAEGQEVDAIAAMAAEARGRVAMAGEDHRGALAPLRRAADAWQELDAPYEAARARSLVALACSELGDEDTATLELEGARAVFQGLEAALDLARVDELLLTGPAGNPYGLTDREVEVLRHLSGGATNKAIAAELVLSVRTVDRHVSNIFSKLGVSSRAAATAYAHEHRVL
jgi:DNA-binding CsgD family transcriptional regulator/tetratricopeptide (TPR) repeat protein